MLTRSVFAPSLAALLVLAGSTAPSEAAEPTGVAKPRMDPLRLSRSDPDATLKALRASPPSCVSVVSQESGDLWVYNGCSTQQRVKVIIAWGPDTPCVAINPGWYGHYTWILGRFDGLAAC